MNIYVHIYSLYSFELILFCIVLENGFIPNSTFLVLNKNNEGNYQSNIISKKLYYKKYIDIPNKIVLDLNYIFIIILN